MYEWTDNLGRCRDKSDAVDEKIVAVNEWIDVSGNAGRQRT